MECVDMDNLEASLKEVDGFVKFPVWLVEDPGTLTVGYAGEVEQAATRRKGES